MHCHACEVDKNWSAMQDGVQMPVFPLYRDAREMALCIFSQPRVDFHFLWWGGVTPCRLQVHISVKEPGSREGQPYKN